MHTKHQQDGLTVMQLWRYSQARWQRVEEDDGQSTAGIIPQLEIDCRDNVWRMIVGEDPGTSREGERVACSRGVERTEQQNTVESQS